MALYELIALCVSCVLTLVGFIWSMVASKQSGTKSKLMHVILLIPNLIFEAEKLFGRGNGAKKVQWVLDQVKIECLKIGVNVTNEYVINLVKAVMKAPQDKESENEILQFLCGIDTVSQKQVETMKTNVQTEIKEGVANGS